MAKRRQGDLDGEYIDSSEGYVTDELDFRRDHFAAARTPLVFSPEDASAGHLPRPDRLRVRPRHRRRHPRAGQADDGQRHARTGSAGWPRCSTCWAPRPTGTPAASWQPMSDAELLYRRALCKGKPFCFLMNTRVRGVLARPGGEVHEAVPGLRDVPRLLQPQRRARATTSRGPSCTTATGRSSRVTCRCASGWPRRAGSRSPAARSDDDHVYVERFGNAAIGRSSTTAASGGRQPSLGPMRRLRRAASCFPAGPSHGTIARRRSRWRAKTWR